MYCPTLHLFSILSQEIFSEHPRSETDRDCSYNSACKKTKSFIEIPYKIYYVIHTFTKIDIHHHIFYISLMYSILSFSTIQIHLLKK